MPISLLKTSSLTFTRDNADGYIGLEGLPIPSTTTELTEVQGSLQPFRTGNNILKNGDYQILTQAGYSSDDARIFYTKTRLQTTNQHLKRKADLTTIDGLTYFVFSVKDWSSYGLFTDHYECILAREDQSVNG